MCVSQDRSFWDRTVCGTCKFMYKTPDVVACTQLGVGWRASMVTRSPSLPASCDVFGYSYMHRCVCVPTPGQGIVTH